MNLERRELKQWRRFSIVLMCLLIAAVTYVICMGGLLIGRKIGTKLTGRASILGGVILIVIGIEIFIGGI